MSTAAACGWAATCVSVYCAMKFPTPCTLSCACSVYHATARVWPNPGHTDTVRHLCPRGYFEQSKRFQRHPYGMNKVGMTGSAYRVCTPVMMISSHHMFNVLREQAHGQHCIFLLHQPFLPPIAIGLSENDFPPPEQLPLAT